MLIKQSAQRIKQSNQELFEIDRQPYILHINKASHEDLRSSYSNQGSLYKANVEREVSTNSPKEQVIVSPRIQSEFSERTLRLITEDGTTTINKAREPAGSQKYYGGLTGTKKKTLSQASSQLSQPYQSKPADITIQQGNSKIKEPTNLEDLLKMNAQQIKIDIQHKPNLAAEPQII